MAVAFGLLSRVDGADGLGLVIVASVALTLGGCLAGLAATSLVLGLAPPERAGVAAAISQTGGELGGALGIAILGTIGTAVYRSRVATTIPTGVGSDHAAAARDTLGGAVAIARDLPVELAAPLLDASRAAFTQGLQAAAVLCVVIAIGLGVLAASRLRTPAAADSEPRPQPDRSRPTFGTTS